MRGKCSTVDAIDLERRRGALITQYPGVHRVGHAAPSVDASFMAAVKACGGDAALGGLAAGHLLQLIKGRVPKPEVYTRTYRGVKGICHNSRHSWERDHQRRREARARNEEFRTYTWTDLPEHREATLAELTELLA